MYETAEAKLERLVQLDINSLTEADITFIRARREWLTETQKTKFKSFLSPTNKKTAKNK